MGASRSSAPGTQLRICFFLAQLQLTWSWLVSTDTIFMVAVLFSASEMGVMVTLWGARILSSDVTLLRKLCRSVRGGGAAMRHWPEGYDFRPVAGQPAPRAAAPRLNQVCTACIDSSSGRGMHALTARAAGRTQRDVHVCPTLMDLTVGLDTPVPSGGHVGGVGGTTVTCRWGVQSRRGVADNASNAPNIFAVVNIWQHCKSKHTTCMWEAESHAIPLQHIMRWVVSLKQLTVNVTDD